MNIVTALLCWLAGLFPASQPPSHAGWYNDIVLFKGEYFAVGTDGRIDRISPSGEKIRVDSSCRYDLRCAFSNDETLLAAGDRGMILFSFDGRSFYRAKSGTEKSINGIASRGGLFIAGADSGTILASRDGKTWNSFSVDVRGNIVAISANPSFFIGVSDSGDIIKSEDGRNWKIQDFNKEYAGYIKRTRFRKIVASPYSIVIIGTHDDGSPSILTSSLGNVWAERAPIYKDNQGAVQTLTATPNGITYDPDRDQFVLVCDNGGLLTLPPCPECSKYAKISETDLHALICTDNSLVIVGDEYSVFTEKLY
jgi:hypothetical protein